MKRGRPFRYRVSVEIEDGLGEFETYEVEVKSEGRAPGNGVGEFGIRAACRALHDASETISKRSEERFPVIPLELDPDS